jgi:dephospho-CoA kinase
MAKTHKLIILGLVGEKSGGKSTVGEYLRKKPGVFFLRFSDVIHSLMEPLGMDIKDRALQGKVGELLRKEFGSDVLARAIVRQAEASLMPLAIIDGFRKPGEMEYLQKLPNFHSIYVTAPVYTRWQRAQLRNDRNDDRVSFMEFQEIERTYPTEVDIHDVGIMADYRIDNVGTEDELHAKVDEVLKKIGIS